MLSGQRMFERQFVRVLRIKAFFLPVDLQHNQYLYSRRDKNLWSQNYQTAEMRVCVLHIKPFFLPVDIQYNSCPCRFFNTRREIQAHYLVLVYITSITWF